MVTLILVFILGLFTGFGSALYMGYRYQRVQSLATAELIDSAGAAEDMAARIAEHLVAQSRKDVLS